LQGWLKSITQVQKSSKTRTNFILQLMRLEVKKKISIELRTLTHRDQFTAKWRICKKNLSQNHVSTCFHCSRSIPLMEESGKLIWFLISSAATNYNLFGQDSAMTGAIFQQLLSTVLLSLSLSHTHSHSFSFSLSLSHTRTLTRFLSLYLTYSHCFSSHSLSFSLSFTHTRSLSLSLSLSLFAPPEISQFWSSPTCPLLSEKKID